MKIIILGTAYPLRGGIAHYNALLYKYLSKEHEVRVITFSRQYPKLFFPGKSQNESGEVGLKIESEVLIDSINPLNWIKVGLNLRKWNADLIIYKYWLPFFVPCFYTIFAICKCFNQTKLLAICDNVIPHEKRFGDKILTKLIFSLTNYFIVQSNTVEKDLLSLKPNANFKNIPHPVYEIFGDKVLKSEAREKLKLKNDENIILFFGYVRKYKGLSVLIKAMNLLRDKIKLKLLVVGEFYDDLKLYQIEIKELNLENNIVVYSDYMPNSEVANYFCACDCVVLPYLNATQSGIVQIAYNFDRPAIVTSVGGLKEVVKNNISGLICEPNNPSALAFAIEKFYSQNLEEKLSAGAEVEKKKYSWENMVNGIEGFL